jgi:hypothetical protein
MSPLLIINIVLTIALIALYFFTFNRKKGQADTGNFGLYMIGLLLLQTTLMIVFSVI